MHTTRLRYASAATALAVMLSGCDDGATTTGQGGGASSSTSGSAQIGSSSATSSQTSGVTSTTTGGSVSPGCGNASAAAGETIRQIEIAGTMRRYIVDAPGAIDPEKPLALTFVFHGNGGTGEASQAMGLQNVGAAKDQALFVFPDGLPFMGFGVGWNGACDGYDMELFDEVIDTLANEYCVDRSRIFAAGFSWGGDMCQSLACCRGDVVRAVAPASGPELYPPNQQCPGTARPALRMTYADNDAYPPAMFSERIAWYREAHGCSDRPMATEPAPCVTYAGCARPVIGCEYAGLGHAWPQDWAAETWKFFVEAP